MNSGLLASTVTPGTRDGIRTPDVPDPTVVLVISGGNIESTRLFPVIRQSLARKGRIMHFSVVLEDQPGTLARLLAVISQERGNILHIHHMQGERDIPVQMARVSIELETRGWEHIEVFKKSLQDNGYEIRMG